MPPEIPECIFRDKVVRLRPSERGWIIELDGERIDWRVILVAPDLAKRPVVLVERKDVDRLQRDLRLKSDVPDDLSAALVGILSAAGHPDATDQEPEPDERMIAEHRELAEAYAALGKRTELDLNSDALFLKAREEKLLRSLALVDERPGRPVMVVRATLPDGSPSDPYLRNVQLVAGAVDWKASACIWDTKTYLFEQTNPLDETYPPADPSHVARSGRCLVLYPKDGLAGRTDLGTLKTTELKWAGPTPPPSGELPVFVVRAAFTTS